MRRVKELTKGLGPDENRLLANLIQMIQTEAWDSDWTVEEAGLALQNYQGPVTLEKETELTTFLETSKKWE